MKDEKIIVFDGVCILCNAFVQFIHKKDRSKQFYFATAQSNYVKEKFASSKLPISPMDSVFYLKNGKVLTESSAVINVLADIGGLYKLLYVFIYVPAFMRNALYRFCAKRRYQVFGKLESCMTPSEDWKDHFYL